MHTRPLDHGADLVVHSATKALNGHSDALAGAVAAAADDPFTQRLRAWRRSAGAVPGGLEAWLLLRGMRTLYPRVRQSSATALRVAEHFADDSRLGSVHYPGLPDHPGHAVAARQMNDGFGSMLSIRVAAGEAAAREVAGRMTVFPTSDLPRRDREPGRAPGQCRRTVDPRFRLTCFASRIGLEQVDDLIADLEQALDHGEADMPVAVPPQDDWTTLRRTVIARGGDVRGTKEAPVAVGSPGAVAPMRDRLGLPAISAADVAGVLAEAIDEPLAAHGGGVEITRDGSGDGGDGVVELRLTGRCRGCAMAQVTVRQGIEPLLREHVRGATAVVDVTDHGAGSDPYYPTAKTLDLENAGRRPQASPRHRRAHHPQRRGTPHSDRRPAAAPRWTRRRR